jgi:AraC-like DNA-binding protein
LGGLTVTATAAGYASFRLPTVPLMPRDEVGIWREVLGRTLMQLDVQRLPQQDWFADMTLTTLPGLRVLAGTVSASHVERTRDNRLADDSDDIALAINVAGAWTAASRGAELVQAPGHAHLVSAAETFSIRRSGAGAMVALCVPRSAIAAIAPAVDDALMRDIPADSPPLALLRRYVAALSGQGAAASPELHHAIVSHVYDLIALAAGPSRDGEAAARLYAMKTDVLQHLDRADLTAARIAERHRMTPRHLRRLFEKDGETFSDFVLAHRLERAHRLLTDPGQAGRAVSSIIYACGFGDVSYFNRSFRRRYGATPSDVRAAAKRRD